MTTATAVPERLRTYVDMLNHMTEDQIHDLMVLNNVKGYRAITNRCPLANYLKLKTGETVLVFEDSFEWGVRADVMTGFPPGQCLPASESVASFVMNFDAGKYPELKCDFAEDVPAS